MRILFRRISPFLSIVLLISFSLFLSRPFINTYINIWSTYPDSNKPNKNNNKYQIRSGANYPPIFAYYISGTGGENKRIIRLLNSIYHPRNQYLLHLDSDSTEQERIELAKYVKDENVFNFFGNVHVLGETYAVDWAGSSVVGSTLHGAAILLRINQDWDWFINLSSEDYPIVTQDDLLQAFKSVPRDLNFIDHTSDLGWKETERFDKIIVDPSLHLKKKFKYIVATKTRKTPDVFKLFTGSPWVILSRPFIENCIHSTDNAPRKLLMYFANVAYSIESYFQTVACNSPDFINKTINTDLRYFLWDNPPGLLPRYLNESNFNSVTASGAAFARRFEMEGPVLDLLDQEVLNGTRKWCESEYNMEKGSCAIWEDVNLVEGGPSGQRLRELVSKVIENRGCSR